ncbi:hypothetical protein WQ57_09955 [Mesobacillus campisalis]|uniref:Uncharacterized protein n=1 Tax=Mesobacillus campisalis TaxID=1408103 RepID=A0A0M2SYS6_9BACI|nr:DUF695 domain-containing protein [Mesobacillus campisalis]KKK38132.1 hypothetical protein WQ57_09955 [Mesobacillus campisalis]
MSENWDIYFDYIDDKIASVVLDLDIWQEIDNEEFNHSFCLRLNLKEPNEDGLPIEKEAEVINEIEDSLIEFLDHRNFINVGRVTTNGVRDVIFYSNQELKNILIDAAHQFVKPAGYEFEIFGIEEDETWEFYYDFLYPNQYQQQHMGNQQVVDSLEESGDQLEVPRKVEHWLLFSDLKMMKRFIKDIKKEGFSIEEEPNQVNEEGKYTVAISRIDSVDLPSINEVTDLLIEISEEHEGEYDGWETFVLGE